MKINKLSAAIRAAYIQGADDETLAPHLLVDTQQKPIGRFKSGDAVIFYNIRGEREIQLTEALTVSNFAKFPIDSRVKLHFATMIEYAPHLPVSVAFPPYLALSDTLSDVLAAHNIKQAKITEAEKAVHVNFFLRGKKRQCCENEEIIILPTRKDVALFDEAPEMSLAKIAEATLAKIADPSFGFIFVNFPNADVVGHIENEAAVLQAVAAVDKYSQIVVEAAIAQGMTVVICSDHGSVEKWRYPDGTPDTGHTDSPVPFVLISDEFKIKKGKGELTDVAPSVLALFGIPSPHTMSGTSLVERYHPPKGGKQRVLFLLLDGWGLAEANEANLLHKAHTPFMDRVLRDYHHAELQAAGEAVGLPQGTVGNSEAGHLHIGAGRRIYSDRLRIDRAIDDGSFFSNEVFIQAMEHAKQGGALHLLGIVSFFSSHGSLQHLFSLIEMAHERGIKEMYIHAMLGRRGETPESGARYLAQVEEKLDSLALGKVVSVLGRYWSLDREENWDRIEKTYRLLVNGEGIAVQEG